MSYVTARSSWSKPACLGDSVAGAELLAPLRALGPELDTFGTTTPPDLGRLHMDPVESTSGQGDGALLADLPASAVELLVSLAGPDADTPLASIEIRHLGGALAHHGPGNAAQPTINAGFLMYCNGMTPTPELTEAVRARARALKDALALWHADYDFYNLRESAGPASAVLPDEAYRRLREIKARYDPQQAIISVHPIWPSRTNR